MFEYVTASAGDSEPWGVRLFYLHDVRRYSARFVSSSILFASTFGMAQSITSPVPTTINAPSRLWVVVSLSR